MKTRLFQIGMETLEKEGWKTERIAGIGKSSVRRVSKGSLSRKIAIRTSQDTWISFPRDKKDKDWQTLSEVDVVLVVSVDDVDDPKFAHVHMIEADEIRRRFDRAYAARRAAGRKMLIGHGVWIPLYVPEADRPVNRVGAGVGLQYPPIARVPLDSKIGSIPTKDSVRDEDRLDIPEAKRRLGLTFGVDPSHIKITVEA